ncbi:hypothetical protein AX16_009949 [Volvariella volvacea WC 439]|nr:hypothetical protein AX16_009949 [Volvariella volvacea WC 439]
MQSDIKLIDTHNHPYYQAISPVQSQPQPRQRNRRRRWLWIATTVLTLSALLWVGSNMSCRQNIGPRTEVFGIPADVSVLGCRDWTIDERTGTGHHLHSAKASYDLPVDSSKLFVYSDGPLALGSVNFLSSQEVNDKVRVEVYASFDEPDILEYAKVCSLQGAQPNTNGVGLLTEYSHRWRHHWQFTIFVYLPKPNESNPIEIQEFETNLPLFAHHVSDIGKDIKFKALTLKTANTPIKVGSVNGEEIIIKTTNSPITGSFNASSSLKLETANAQIDVAVHLHNADESKPTTLDATTVNSPLKAAISLTSAQLTGGAFKVDATTSAGGLELAVYDAPVDHTLTLRGQNSYSPIKAILPASYEGSIDGQTTWSRFNLRYDPAAEDPAGRGRQRHLDVTRVRGSSDFEGKVYWSEKGRDRGSVELVTSFSPVNLEL